MERPILKQPFRPHRSVSLPPGIMSAAMTNKNRVMAIWTPWTVGCRSWLMSLIMTFMFEPAKLQMNWARARGSSIRRSDGAILPVSTGFAIAQSSPSFSLRFRGAHEMPKIARPTVESSIQVQRSSDEREVGERLGEVADLFTGGIDL